MNINPAFGLEKSTGGVLLLHKDLIYAYLFYRKNVRISLHPRRWNCGPEPPDLRPDLGIEAGDHVTTHQQRQDMRAYLESQDIYCAQPDFLDALIRLFQSIEKEVKKGASNQDD